MAAFDKARSLDPTSVLAALDRTTEVLAHYRRVRAELVAHYTTM